MIEKNPQQWDVLNIKNLIESEVQEHISLDYKSCDSLGKSEGKKSEISKDVSSFANADGGIIIYGVKEYDVDEKRHLPEKIDSGYDQSEFSKEWLEQVIQSNIYPKIEGLLFDPC